MTYQDEEMAAIVDITRMTSAEDRRAHQLAEMAIKHILRAAHGRSTAAEFMKLQQAMQREMTALEDGDE